MGFRLSRGGNGAKKENMGRGPILWGGGGLTLCVVGALHPVWPDKNCQMSIKLPKNDFTRKMIDFETFTKIA